MQSAYAKSDSCKNSFMIKNLIIFLKGFSMGLANVVPGVSGGTIALLAGVFERLINALKSFDIEALKLLSKFKFREFAQHVDLVFLICLFLGEIISVLTAAKLLDYAFKIHNGIYVWAFFFGLILVSVFYIGKQIKKINLYSIILMLVGATVAFATSIISPANENDNIFYLIFCGAIAICDMLLPGISGSYTLILLGNYKLIIVDSISHLFDSYDAFFQNIQILLPFAIGAAIGFLAFSRFLSWLMKNYGDQTLAILTGFVFGSLAFIWPWKHPIYQMINGHEVFNKHGEPIIEGYNKYFPDLTSETFIAIAFIILGIVTLCLIEELSSRKTKKAK